MQAYSHAQDLKSIEKSILPISISEEKREESFPRVAEESP